MGEGEELKQIADILRRDVILMTSEAGSGHLTSSLSSAELFSCLFFNELRFDPKNPLNSNSDEFILSKGHASPILYSALYRAGCISTPLSSLRNVNSPLEGHPMPPLFGWVKFATGSLGQGLSIGLGTALAAKLSKKKSRTYVLMGDSELAEGSIYEALQLASYYKLDNLTAIVDINKLGQRGETMLAYDLKSYKARFESFGWNVLTVDGHNIKEILKTFEQAKKSKQPSVILAKTTKGKGILSLEGKNGWHGKALSKDEAKKALKKFDNLQMPKTEFILPEPLDDEEHKFYALRSVSFKPTQQISTRESYGLTLAEIAKSDSRVIALDAEVSNSTFSEYLKKKTPKQFIECFIAEQNMLGIALGLSKKGYHPYVSTFSAFLTRAHDQIRMASISGASFTIAGSHCGVSIGEDGASQMGLDDISMFRAIPNSTIFYPSDAVSTQKILQLTKDLSGIKYLRTTRGKTPLLYSDNETFEIGEFKVIKAAKEDKVVLVGAGITLHECLKSFEELRLKKISSSVIDCYCIKPFNSQKFIEYVKSHGNRIVIAEDHFREGGIGEMIASAISNTDIKLVHLAVDMIPHSGKPEELLEKYRIDSKSIVSEVLNLVKSDPEVQTSQSPQKKPKKK